MLHHLMHSLDNKNSFTEVFTPGIPILVVHKLPY
jgi:hypothetical protein